MPKKCQKRSNGLFEFKTTIGRDPSGKAIRKSFYSSKSMADARKQGERYKQDILEGRVTLVFDEPQAEPEVKTEEKTFEDWSEEWLAVYKKPFVSEATYRTTYEAYVRNHMIPFFGDQKLNKITQFDVQKYFSSKTDKSESFLKKNRFMLSSIFETAIENDLCSKNPVKHIKFTSMQEKRVKKALSDSDMYLLERCAEGKRPEIILLLNTGLRRGELCGLQWSDYDEKKRTLTVNRAIAESGGKCSINHPKFDSFRTIPLNDKALSVLQSLPRNSLWIFPGKTGNYRRPDKWSDILDKFMKTVPEPVRCTSHELRHTYGSYLRRHGVDIYTIQKILGHKDINVTADIYVHADIEAIRNEICQISMYDSLNDSIKNGTV